MMVQTTLQGEPLTHAERRMVVGTPDQFRWLYGIIKAFLILNLLDAVLTIVWVQTGLAREGNPLLEPLVSHHAMLFILTKTALGSVAAWLLWEYRHRAYVVISAFSAFIAYYAVLLQHLRVAIGFEYFT